MKVIIEFNLPEDQEEHDIFINASKFYCSLENIRNFIRKLTKHTILNEETESILNQIEELIYE